MAKAVFSFQAPVAFCIASENKPALDDERNKASLKRTSVIPISSRVFIADCPLPSMLPNPVIKAVIASPALSLNAEANCSLLIPATSAYCSSLSLPVSTANCISTMTLEKALPPASASIPTDDKAPAKPTIWASVIPT